MNKRKIITRAFLLIFFCNLCHAEDSLNNLPPNLILEPCYSLKTKKPKHVERVEKSSEKLQYQPAFEESSVIRQEAREVERVGGSEYKAGTETVIDPKPAIQVKDEELKEEEVPASPKPEPAHTHRCACSRHQD